MGLPLAKLVKPKKISFSSLSGKALAIDAFNAIYQFLALIRRGPGVPLTDSHGRVTSHLNGLLFRTVRLIELGIRPAYVFDGPPPDFKRRTLQERRAIKEKAEREWVEALARGDFRTAWAKAVQTSRLTPLMADDAKRLLDLMGVPWVQAPSEGEAQAAHMAAKGDVWAAASQDYDSLLFGSPRLVRNVTITGKRKLPGRDVYVEVRPEIISLRETLESLGITREQLILLGILVGTDYNPGGVRGVGPKRALEIVRRHRTVEEVERAIKWEFDVPLREIYEFFLSPPVTDEYDVTLKRPDAEGLLRFMVDEHEFSEKRVRKVIEEITEAYKMHASGGLEAWF
ncbi:MAG: flap endonuclease-1 [Candidatus Korarchaeota archaeon]|nr:flap endonuclease-1 [Candidatus Korarchaeota archaeon]